MPDLSVSGFTDVSAHWNANSPDSGTSALRAYDRKADSFYLNAVHVALSLAPVEGASVVVEVDGGSDADFNKNGQVDSLELDLQEAYVSYVHDGTGLGFRAGKAATFMGIEIIESPEDPTVTRGFLFALAECGTHTGAFATWASGAFDAALGVVNGWDVVVDNNTGKTVAGKATWSAGGDGGATLSFLVGPEQADNSHDTRQTYDLTGFVTVEGVKVNLQALYGNEAIGGGHAHWVGGGVQPVVPITEDFSIGARVERFCDPDGARTGVAGGTTVNNVSVSPAFVIVKNLTVRLEGRVDFSNGGDAFEDEEGDPTNTQVTLSAEVFFRF
jgi:hypothetical protein